MKDKLIYKSGGKERSHASTPIYTAILLIIVCGYMYYQNGTIDTVFIAFSVMGVAIVSLIAIRQKSFDIYSNHLEIYHAVAPSDRKTVLLKDLKHIELKPAKYNDWSTNKFALHLKDGTTITLDGGTKYIEVLKKFNSLRYKIAVAPKKHNNYYVKQAKDAGVRFS